MPHRSRPGHVWRHPVHVTMRAVRGLPSFRAELVKSLIVRALEAQAARAGAAFQVVHFSIQRDHLHLIVEAPRRDGDAARDLRRGVAGLAISLARRLNRLLGRRGKLWGDRHHRRELESPTAIRRTLIYVLQNHVHHGLAQPGRLDPFTTASTFDGWASPSPTGPPRVPCPAPRAPDDDGGTSPRRATDRNHDPSHWRVVATTWLLRLGWQKAGGKIRHDERPA